MAFSDPFFNILTFSNLPSYIWGMTFEGKKIHFIGIGGVGVNALAKFCMDAGAKISGSDRKANDLCAEILAKGARIIEGEDPSLVDNADIVVFSSAISDNNTELARARELNRELYERQEFLRIISLLFPICVAIGGTHGKTTVTAMVTHVLSCADKKFCAMIGGQAINYGNYVNNIGDGISLDVPLKDMFDKNRAIFVTEACEYKRNLLSLEPNIALVTNAECDHPDCYKDEQSVKRVFAEFLEKADFRIVSADNASLISNEEKICARDIAKNEKRFALISRDDGNGTVKILKCIVHDVDGDKGSQKLEVYCDEKFACEFVLKMGGEYNAYNALCAIAVCDRCGVTFWDCAKSLENFSGVARRFEYAGTLKGRPVYFDFAHHPTEISCAIERARKYGRVLAVFQPHTYTRTKAYFADFVDTLASYNNGVSTLVLMPTYGARERASEGCDTDKLAEAIFEKYPEKQVYNAKNNLSTLDFVEKCACDCDIIMFIGAGDIYSLKDVIEYDK